MILADSSILIELQRKPSPRVREIIRSHDAAVTGVTHAELLAGVRTERERSTVVALLGTFRRVAVDERVWDHTGDIAARLRARGRRLPLLDGVIAATAIHNALPLWTRDADFYVIQAVAPELMIFDEPGR